jgi:soluble lytic murein transglycosylase
VSSYWASRQRRLALALSPIVLVTALAGAAAAATVTVPIPQLRPVNPSVVISTAPQLEITDAVAAKVAAWLEAVSGRPDVGSAQIAAVLTNSPDWPAQTQLRQRFEQALVREAPKPETVVAAFANRTPITADGTLLYARALAALGRGGEAAAVVRRSWRTQDLSDAAEQAILKQFRDVLTPADHAARVERFLYAELTGGATRNAKLLDTAHRALVDARVAVINGSSSAGKLLDQVPQALRGEPGYVFAKAQYLRRASKFAEAAALLLAAPTDPALLGDPDAWSEERRELARRFIDIGDPWTAYQLVAAANAASQTPRVEAEFEAGWYALVFLNDPDSARPHFQAIADNSKTPISRARAAYWLARAAEAKGNAAEAAELYGQSAQYSIAFYGQLAAAKLGRGELDATAPGAVPPDVAAGFADRELVQALAQLQRNGRTDEANLFYRHLASTLVDTAELNLLTDLAQRQGRYALVVQIGKAAQQRGVAVGTLAFPTTALPAYSGKVGMPVIYSIARQESEFEQSVVSSAGAVGVMQVMPQFAGEMARRGGIPYSPARIRTDALYNIQIGASELGYLLSMYDGSYVLAFAAYNAGAGRVAQWTKAFGDPRDPDVDVIDWIERIPYGETRNYVQRAMENLGVYRALFGDPTLRIAADLRGTPTTKIASGALPTAAAQPAAIGVSYAPRPVTVTVTATATATATAKPAAPPKSTVNGVAVMTEEELAARIAVAEANVTRVAYRIAGEDQADR